MYALAAFLITLVVILSASLLGASQVYAVIAGTFCAGLIALAVLTDKNDPLV
jgi:hypothetical protein